MNSGRTKLVGIDVMLNHGTRFYKTLYYRASERFDMTTGKWGIVLDDEELEAWAKEQLPSLNDRQFTLEITA